MKKFVLASLFVVAAAAVQPALAAKAGVPQLCAKGTKVCACGKLSRSHVAVLQCQGKVRLFGRPPRLQTLTTPAA